MIHAYPGAPCIRAGKMLQLHVATGAPVFEIHFARWGAHVREVAGGAAFPGCSAPPGSAGEPWNWPAYEIATEDDWPPGVYTAILRAERDTGMAFDARSARALFVVRPPHPQAPLLVVLPVFTYQAYNVAHVDGTLGADEGESLYSGAQWVTLHRPGGGNGGHPWDEVNADAYDRASPRQTFVHWDGAALAWLEREGIPYDCCTDLELHDGSIDLGAYAAVASFGHHEYWTDAMRERMERYVAAGGNVAFFGGNTCWFRLAYDASRSAISRIGRWSDDPEWRFTGVSYARGGGKWIGARPATGYTVETPEHWIFAGTGLQKGSVFGAQERLVGYECDGAPAASDAQILASASVADWPVRDGSGEVSQTARGDMTLREAGGTIFSASTVDWARVLAAGEPHVARITRNVLERFTASRTAVPLSIRRAY